MSVDPQLVQVRYEKLRADAEDGGYRMNPDESFTLSLVAGLLTNEERYGYPSCPCRLALGDKQQDLDIICPCDYRDPDLNDHGACYCALYISEEVFRGERELTPVPERRPSLRPRSAPSTQAQGMTLWRCKVCGYLCARENPPGVCPVCKAKGDRFEAFTLPTNAIPVEER